VTSLQHDLPLKFHFLLYGANHRVAACAESIANDRSLRMNALTGCQSYIFCPLPRRCCSVNSLTHRLTRSQNRCRSNHRMGMPLVYGLPAAFLPGRPIPCSLSG
jgi:hypothetical protein